MTAHYDASNACELTGILIMDSAKQYNILFAPTWVLFRMFSDIVAVSLSVDCIIRKIPHCVKHDVGSESSYAS